MATEKNVDLLTATAIQKIGIAGEHASDRGDCNLAYIPGTH